MRTIRRLGIAVFILATMVAQSQERVYRYNSSTTNLDEASSLAVAGGKTFVTGSSFSPITGWDIVTFGLDGNTDTLWTRRFFTPDDEKASLIVADANGNLYVLGYGWRNERWQTMVLKYDATGNMVWSTTYNGSDSSSDVGFRSVILLNNTIVIAIHSTEANSISSVRVVAFDSGGSQLWEDQYSGIGIAEPLGLSSASNLLAVVGRTSSLSDQDGFLLLFDQAGTRLATVVYDGGNTNTQSFSTVAVDGVGNVYVAGWDESSTTSDAILHRYNVDGSLYWSTKQATLPNSLSRSIALAVTPTGNPVLTARMKSGNDDDVFTAQFLASSGLLDWSHTFAGPGANTDVSPPLFAGASGARATGTQSLLLSWPSAHDDESMSDEIEYLVYLSTVRSGQNFSVPTQTVKGKTSVELQGLQPNTSYYLVVRAQDVSGNMDVNTREIVGKTQNSALKITTLSLPDGTINDPYSVTLNASGGQPPYQWNILSGSLPDGLQLQTDGQVNGVPTTTGATTFLVRVMDATGDTATITLSITIQTPSSLYIRTTSLPDGTAGQAYPDFSLKAENGTPPYTWSLTSGDIPTPDFISGDGTLAGFLSIPGDYSMEFQVTDSKNATARKALILNVGQPPDFLSTNNASIPGGSHWYHDFVVKSGHTVTTVGNVSLNITGKLMVESSGVLRSLNCDSLVLNLLSVSATPEILGEIRNNCDSMNKVGGDLVIRTIGNLQCGSLTNGDPKAVIKSSGVLHLGDPWYSPRAKEDTMVYAHTGEVNAKAPPVCAIKGGPLLGSRTFPETISFEVIHKDPDGGISAVNTIDYGDGIIVTNPVPPFSHQFTMPGVYKVTAEVIDDESDTSFAYMTINLRPALTDTISVEEENPSLWASPLQFSADSLVKPVGIPFSFTYEADSSLAQHEWDLDETSSSSGQSVQYAFQNAGTTKVSVQAESIDGVVSVAMMTIYVPLEGGLTKLKDPPAPKQWFPPLPPRIHSEPPPGEMNHTTDCPDCNLCADPFSAPGPVVVLGAVTVSAGTLDTTAWALGPLVIGFGFTNATVVVMPDFVFAGFPGAPGSATRPNGRWGFGIHIGTLSGRLVMCGGNFVLADGGDGFPVTDNGCSSFARGGNGGRSSPVWLSTPNGRLSFCDSMNVQLANGGDGGSATSTGDPAPGACKDGCNAKALGGKGAYGGGGIFYGASQLCYDADYRLAFTAPGGSVSGGLGGLATATASAGAACADCGKPGGRGGTATAFGGDGGGCSWYFITSFIPDTSLTNGHFFPRAAFLGGAGNDGVAIAGGGGNSACSGCTGEEVIAGKGGNAYAYGGDGGYGGPRGAGGNVTATAGNGGTATMTPNPAKSADGCPGKTGCKTIAIGGKGGSTTAVRGRGKPNGVTLARTDGSGGNANATGGNGGDGVGCPKCNGGRGGDAIANAGNRGGTRGGATAGTAAAIGGTGGNGSTCCTPPKDGGNGGRGGDAFANTYASGATAGNGGNGGNGGDGCQPGSKGLKGKGNGNPNPIPDGKDGVDGKDCCQPVKCDFFAPFDQLVIETIPPGSDRILSTAEGQIRIHFADPAEIFQNTGQNLNPAYQIFNGPFGPAINVFQGWVEIWQDVLACLPERDSATVSVQQPPVYSSSFNASRQALMHDNPANNGGNHVFVVDSGTEQRIGYQVIWSPMSFAIVRMKMN